MPTAQTDQELFQKCLPSRNICGNDPGLGCSRAYIGARVVLNLPSTAATSVARQWLMAFVSVGAAAPNARTRHGERLDAFVWTSRFAKGPSKQAR